MGDGTPCDDGVPETNGDSCSAGVCSGTQDCDDRDPCTQDSVDPDTHECIHATAPALGCRNAASSLLQFSTGNGGKIRWKWKAGEATSCDELGFPDSQTDYVACIYDGAAGQWSIAARIELPANGLWESDTSCRWSYRDRSALRDGIGSASLSPGGAGRPAIQLKADGPLAPIPAPAGSDRFFSMDPGLTIQLFNGSAVCWQSEFVAAQAARNSGELFKGRARYARPQ